MNIRKKLEIKCLNITNCNIQTLNRVYLFSVPVIWDQSLGLPYKSRDWILHDGSIIFKLTSYHCVKNVQMTEFFLVQIQGNTAQKKLRILTLSCSVLLTWAAKYGLFAVQIYSYIVQIFVFISDTCFDFGNCFIFLISIFCG